MYLATRPKTALNSVDLALLPISLVIYTIRVGGRDLPAQLGGPARFDSLLRATLRSSTSLLQ